MRRRVIVAPTSDYIYTLAQYLVLSNPYSNLSLHLHLRSKMYGRRIESSIQRIHTVSRLATVKCIINVTSDLEDAAILRTGVRRKVYTFSLPFKLIIDLQKRSIPALLCKGYSPPTVYCAANPYIHSLWLV